MIVKTICWTVLLVCFLVVIYISSSAAQIHEQKRLPNPFHMRALRAMSRKDVLRAIYRGLTRVRRAHHHMTDAGYGSRVQAGSRMANALIAQHDLYGAFGPGRRKRTSPSEESQGHNTEKLINLDRR